MSALVAIEYFLRFTDDDDDDDEGGGVMTPVLSGSIMIISRIVFLCAVAYTATGGLGFIYS